MSGKFKLKIKQKYGNNNEYYDYVKVHCNRIEVLAWVVPSIATVFTKKDAEYFCKLNDQYNFEIEEVLDNKIKQDRNVLAEAVSNSFVYKDDIIFSNKETVKSQSDVIGFYYDKKGVIHQIKRKSEYGKIIMKRFSN